MVDEVKEIFLDIDGVLNSTRSVHAKYGTPLADPQKLMALAKLQPEFGVTYSLQCVDPICVALLNKLIVQSRAGLVLSSSHRGYLCTADAPKGSPEHLERLRLYLQVLGVIVPSRFSITPVCHAPRGYEIDAWIEAHGEPDRYVILDDARDFSPMHPLVHCDASYGLDFENFAHACTLIGIDPPSTILM